VYQTPHARSHLWLEMTLTCSTFAKQGSAPATGLPAVADVLHGSGIAWRRLHLHWAISESARNGAFFAFCSRTRCVEVRPEQHRALTSVLAAARLGTWVAHVVNLQLCHPFMQSWSQMLVTLRGSVTDHSIRNFRHSLHVSLRGSSRHTRAEPPFRVEGSAY